MQIWEGSKLHCFTWGVWSRQEKQSTTWKCCAARVCVCSLWPLSFFPPLSLLNDELVALEMQKTGQIFQILFLHMKYFTNSFFDRLLCTTRFPFLLYLGKEFLIWTWEYWLFQSWENLHSVSLRYDIQWACMEKSAGKLMYSVTLNSLLPGIYAPYLNYINFWLSAVPA